jgi:hypothetical protein
MGKEEKSRAEDRMNYQQVRIKPYCYNAFSGAGAGTYLLPA